jgi:hypothetical protein
MIRKLMLGAAAALICAGGAASDSTRKVSKDVTVPKGMYVYSNNPSCGVRHPDVIGMAANDKTAAATAALWGPKAGAVVVLVSQANKIVEECGGGDLCRKWREAKGIEDHSSCATMCVSTPRGATLVGAYASDRDGGPSKLIAPSKMAVTGKGWERDQKDWSGWENVYATKNTNDQWVVCGTAKNWSDNKSARKILTAVYEK